MKTLIIQSDSDMDLELISDLANKKGAKHYFVDNNILQEYIEDIGLANAMKSIDNDENETVDFDLFMQELSSASHN
jgi:hypothetical protein